LIAPSITPVAAQQIILAIAPQGAAPAPHSDTARGACAAPLNENAFK
jgi:hypothetical protein